MAICHSHAMFEERNREAAFQRLRKVGKRGRQRRRVEFVKPQMHYNYVENKRIRQSNFSLNFN
jgi:hypothetical protein